MMVRKSSLERVQEKTKRKDLETVNIDNFFKAFLVLS